MKVYGECECGGPLLRATSKQCRRCAIIAHPGSSQCPYCLEWYYTHSGNVTLSGLEHHAKKRCI